MPRLNKKTLQLAMRVCDRIQQQDGAQNPALPSAALSHVAYWIVRYAVAGSADPTAAAFCRIFGEPNPPPITLCPLQPTDPIELIAIDGRTPAQWFQSVTAYLDWRSGIDWRNSMQRDDPERDAYLSARRLMRESFYSPTPTPPAQHLLPPKKPSRSVRLAAAMKATR